MPLESRERTEPRSYRSRVSARFVTPARLRRFGVRAEHTAIWAVVCFGIHATHIVFFVVRAGGRLLLQGFIELRFELVDSLLHQAVKMLQAVVETLVARGLSSKNRDS